MGSGSSIPQDVHVVIVGAGYGGSCLALKLQKNGSNFTVIDEREVFHHNVAAVRAVAVPDFVQKTLIPLEATFGSNFKKGLVRSVNPGAKTVMMDGGEEVSYDILVLATGTRGPFPSKFGNQNKEDAIDMYSKYAQKVKDSQRIVLVGGGAVGVEIAAEIATEYPDKHVTLIHSRTALVTELSSAKFQSRLNEILNNLKIKVILDEKVANLDKLEDGPGTVQTTSGTSVDADLVIVCTGLKVNTSAYKESLVGGAMEQNGALRINRYFQVEGYEDIFSLGDCCHSGDPWMAYKADDHAVCVFENIKRKCKNQELKPYNRKGSENSQLIVVSLGRNNGIGQTDGGSMLPEFMCKTLKSSDLFVGKYWGTMKQKVPK